MFDFFQFFLKADMLSQQIGTQIIVKDENNIPLLTIDNSDHNRSVTINANSITINQLINAVSTQIFVLTLTQRIPNLSFSSTQLNPNCLIIPLLTNQADSSNNRTLQLAGFPGLEITQVDGPKLSFTPQGMTNLTIETKCQNSFLSLNSNNSVSFSHSLSSKVLTLDSITAAAFTINGTQTSLPSQTACIINPGLSYRVNTNEIFFTFLATNNSIESATFFNNDVNFSLNNLFQSTGVKILFCSSAGVNYNKYLIYFGGRPSVVANNAVFDCANNANMICVTQGNVWDVNKNSPSSYIYAQGTTTLKIGEKLVNFNSGDTFFPMLPEFINIGTFSGYGLRPKETDDLMFQNSLGSITAKFVSCFSTRSDFSFNITENQSGQLFIDGSPVTGNIDICRHFNTAQTNIFVQDTNFNSIDPFGLSVLVAGGARTVMYKQKFSSNIISASISYPGNFALQYDPLLDVFTAETPDGMSCPLVNGLCFLYATQDSDAVIQLFGGQSVVQLKKLDGSGDFYTGYLSYSTAPAQAGSTASIFTKALGGGLQVNYDPAGYTLALGGSSPTAPQLNFGGTIFQLFNSNLSSDFFQSFSFVASMQYFFNSLGITRINLQSLITPYFADNSALLDQAFTGYLVARNHNDLYVWQASQVSPNYYVQIYNFFRTDYTSSGFIITSTGITFGATSYNFTDNPCRIFCPSGVQDFLGVHGSLVASGLGTLVNGSATLSGAHWVSQNDDDLVIYLNQVAQSPSAQTPKLQLVNWFTSASNFDNFLINVDNQTISNGTTTLTFHSSKSLLISPASGEVINTGNGTITNNSDFLLIEMDGSDYLFKTSSFPQGILVKNISLVSSVIVNPTSIIINGFVVAQTLVDSSNVLDGTIFWPSSSNPYNITNTVSLLEKRIDSGTSLIFLDTTKYITLYNFTTSGNPNYVGFSFGQTAVDGGTQFTIQDANGSGLLNGNLANFYLPAGVYTVGSSSINLSNGIFIKKQNNTDGLLFNSLFNDLTVFNLFSDSGLFPAAMVLTNNTGFSLQMVGRPESDIYGANFLTFMSDHWQIFLRQLTGTTYQHTSFSGLSINYVCDFALQTASLDVFMQSRTIDAAKGVFLINFSGGFYNGATITLDANVTQTQITLVTPTPSKSLVLSLLPQSYGGFLPPASHPNFSTGMLLDNANKIFTSSDAILSSFLLGTSPFLLVLNLYNGASILAATSATTSLVNNISVTALGTNIDGTFISGLPPNSSRSITFWPINSNPYGIINHIPLGELLANSDSFNQNFSIFYTDLSHLDSWDKTLSILGPYATIINPNIAGLTFNSDGTVVDAFGAVCSLTSQNWYLPSKAISFSDTQLSSIPLNFSQGIFGTRNAQNPREINLFNQLFTNLTVSNFFQNTGNLIFAASAQLTNTGSNFVFSAKGSNDNSTYGSNIQSVSVDNAILVLYNTPGTFSSGKLSFTFNTDFTILPVNANDYKITSRQWENNRFLSNVSSDFYSGKIIALTANNGLSVGSSFLPSGSVDVYFFPGGGSSTIGSVSVASSDSDTPFWLTFGTDTLLQNAVFVSGLTIKNFSNSSSLLINSNSITLDGLTVDSSKDGVGYVWAKNSIVCGATCNVPIFQLPINATDSQIFLDSNIFFRALQFLSTNYTGFQFGINSSGEWIKDCRDTNSLTAKLNGVLANFYIPPLVFNSGSSSINLSSGLFGIKNGIDATFFNNLVQKSVVKNFFTTSDAADFSIFPSIMTLSGTSADNLSFTLIGYPNDVTYGVNHLGICTPQSTILLYRGSGSVQITNALTNTNFSHLTDVYISFINDAANAKIQSRKWDPTFQRVLVNWENTYYTGTTVALGATSTTNFNVGLMEVLSTFLQTAYFFPTGNYQFQALNISATAPFSLGQESMDGFGNLHGNFMGGGTQGNTLVDVELINFFSQMSLYSGINFDGTIVTIVPNPTFTTQTSLSISTSRSGFGAPSLLDSNSQKIPWLSRQLWMEPGQISPKFISSTFFTFVIANNNLQISSVPNIDTTITDNNVVDAYGLDNVTPLTLTVADSYVADNRNLEISGEIQTLFPGTYAVVAKMSVPTVIGNSVTQAVACNLEDNFSLQVSQAPNSPDLPGVIMFSPASTTELTSTTGGVANYVLTLNLTTISLSKNSNLIATFSLQAGQDYRFDFVPNPMGGDSVFTMTTRIGRDLLIQKQGVTLLNPFTLKNYYTDSINSIVASDYAVCQIGYDGSQYPTVSVGPTGSSVVWRIKSYRSNTDRYFFDNLVYYPSTFNSGTIAINGASFITSVNFWCLIDSLNHELDIFYTPDQLPVCIINFDGLYLNDSNWVNVLGVSNSFVYLSISGTSVKIDDFVLNHVETLVSRPGSTIGFCIGTPGSTSQYVWYNAKQYNITAKSSSSTMPQNAFIYENGNQGVNLQYINPLTGLSGNFNRTYSMIQDASISPKFVSLLPSIITIGSASYYIPDQSTSLGADKIYILTKNEDSSTPHMIHVAGSDVNFNFFTGLPNGNLVYFLETNGSNQNLAVIFDDCSYPLRFETFYAGGVLNSHYTSAISLNYPAKEIVINGLTFGPFKDFSSSAAGSNLLSFSDLTYFYNGQFTDSLNYLSITCEQNLGSSNPMLIQGIYLNQNFFYIYTNLSVSGIMVSNPSLWNNLAFYNNANNWTGSASISLAHNPPACCMSILLKPNGITFNGDSRWSTDLTKCKAIVIESPISTTSFRVWSTDCSTYEDVLCSVGVNDTKLSGFSVFSTDGNTLNISQVLSLPTYAYIVWENSNSFVGMNGSCLNLYQRNYLVIDYNNIEASDLIVSNGTTFNQNTSVNSLLAVPLMRHNSSGFYFTPKIDSMSRDFFAYMSGNTGIQSAVGTNISANKQWIAESQAVPLQWQSLGGVAVSGNLTTGGLLYSNVNPFGTMLVLCQSSSASQKIPNILLRPMGWDDSSSTDLGFLWFQCGTPGTQTDPFLLCKYNSNSGYVNNQAAPVFFPNSFSVNRVDVNGNLAPITDIIVRNKPTIGEKTIIIGDLNGITITKTGSQLLSATFSTGSLILPPPKDTTTGFTFNNISYINNDPTSLLMNPFFAINKIDVATVLHFAQIDASTNSAYSDGQSTAFLSGAFSTQSGITSLITVSETAYLVRQKSKCQNAYIGTEGGFYSIIRGVGSSVYNLSLGSDGIKILSGLNPTITFTDTPIYPACVQTTATVVVEQTVVFLKIFAEYTQQNPVSIMTTEAQNLNFVPPLLTVIGSDGNSSVYEI